MVVSRHGGQKQTMQVLGVFGWAGWRLGVRCLRKKPLLGWLLAMRARGVVSAQRFVSFRCSSLGMFSSVSRKECWRRSGSVGWVAWLHGGGRTRSAAMIEKEGVCRMTFNLCLGIPQPQRRERGMMDDVAERRMQYFEAVGADSTGMHRC